MSLWIVALVAEVIVCEENAEPIPASSVHGPGRTPPTQFDGLSKLVPVPDGPPLQATTITTSATESFQNANFCQVFHGRVFYADGES